MSYIIINSRWMLTQHNLYGLTFKLCDLNEFKMLTELYTNKKADGTPKAYSIYMQ